jgi:hypothetical protein
VVVGIGMRMEVGVEVGVGMDGSGGQVLNRTFWTIEETMGRKQPDSHISSNQPFSMLHFVNNFRNGI